MGGVPSVPKDRTRTLQVIGAGYSRTGTVSMSLALGKLLDGPVMHGGTQLFGREDAYVKLWCDIFENRDNKPVLMKLLREATAGFVAITDSPATIFLAELIELYPDAKVVLVTRDPDRWFKSMELIIKQVKVPPLFLKVLLLPCPTWRWAPQWLNYMGQMETKRLGSQWSKDRLLAYNDWVRAHVPSDRLITMELKEGWEPLAKLVNKPIPNEPFPRANDSEAMVAFSKRLFRTAGLIWVGILVGVMLLSWGGLQMWKRNHIMMAW